MALEARIDADLRLGRHAAVVPELEVLVDGHPLREGLRAQLMTALYRCGRQAEALRVYQRTRQVLGEELGIEPSLELRHLRELILMQDTDLDRGRAVSKRAPGGRQRNPQFGDIAAIPYSGVTYAYSGVTYAAVSPPSTRN